MADVGENESLPAGGVTRIQKGAWITAAIAAPLVLWFGNPAVGLLIGMMIALSFNVSPIPSASRYGKLALQTAIVLLGFGLNAGEMLSLSGDFALVIGFYVMLTLCLGIGLGALLKCEQPTSRLISAGTAICGGTAIASLSSIVRAAPAQTGVAMALVFLLNAVALLVLPHVGVWLEMSQREFGIWMALAVHDTSSVVASAAIYGDEAAEVATTLKIGRTLWLIPVILLFSLLEKAPDAKLRIPLFVALFVVASVAGTLLTVPEVVTDVSGSVSKLLLVLALFCIGTEISRSTFREMKPRSLLLGLVLWLLVLPTTWLVATELG